MSLLYKALRAAAERDRSRAGSQPPIPLAPADGRQGRRRLTSRSILLALLKIVAVGTAGLFAWPSVERLLGPHGASTVTRAVTGLLDGDGHRGNGVARLPLTARQTASRAGADTTSDADPEAAAPGSSQPASEADASVAKANAARTPAESDANETSARNGSMEPASGAAGMSGSDGPSSPTGSAEALEQLADAGSYLASPLPIAGPEARVDRTRAEQQAARATVEPRDEPAAQVRSAAPEVNIDRSLDSGENGANGKINVVNETAGVLDQYRDARHLMRLGNYGRALATYEALLEDVPEERTALLGRATALYKLGRRADAVEAYRAVLRHHPDDLAALTNLVGLLGERVPVRTIDRLERVYDRNPRYAPAAAQLGMAHARNGELDKAVGFMAQASELRPDDLVYQVNLAILHDRAGRKRQAVRAYKRALELVADSAGPTPLSAEAIRQRLHYLGTN